MIGRVRRRYHVTGVVQGVGFRPFVYQQAASLGLIGTVANDVDGVVIEAEGAAGDVDELARRLTGSPPPLAVVESLTVAQVPLCGGTGFAIRPSARAAGSVRTLIGPDIATCDDCLRELRDRAGRRYRHPFISCTNCGPRFSIIRGVPYDRPLTTMAGFDMCEACAAEYADPADRRFHAQTIACHDCGPALELLVPGTGSWCRDAAIGRARQLLAEGAILAVKGLGGYHLACDARNDTAVAELRRRKRRGDKPFAVMVPGIRQARALAALSPQETALLAGPRRPVVLVRRGVSRGVGAGADRGLSAQVAPGCPDLGLLLPYTPLHHLLLEPGAGLGSGSDDDLVALVMTSGNLGGEPIAYTDDDAIARLGGLADAFLRHDRPIQVPVDDSVTRVVAGREAPVRRSRGVAPLPITLPVTVTAVLAAGADLKNTCAVGQGRHAWLSQHIGDMDDLATLTAFTATQSALEELAGVTPVVAAADLHPGYRSTAWARRHCASHLVEQEPMPLRSVQHHHAHVAAVMAEHGLDGARPVLGFAFDGTGYGTDGAVWGGELLIADYRGFQREAHLAYVPLPGGDLAVQRPYRMALSLLHAAGLDWTSDLAPVAVCPAPEQRVLAHQLQTGFGTAPTSSMGRLFDAVAALTGVRQVADYEAQAAIELEGFACQADPDCSYDFTCTSSPGGPVLADPRPVVRALVRDLRQRVPVPQLAARFHASVTELMVTLAQRARRRTGLDVVVLGGGVFSNTILLAHSRRRLEACGFEVLSAEQLPCNDGGIALGQLMIAAAHPVEQLGRTV